MAICVIIGEGQPDETEFYQQPVSQGQYLGFIERVPNAAGERDDADQDTRGTRRVREEGQRCVMDMMMVMLLSGRKL